MVATSLALTKVDFANPQGLLTIPTLVRNWAYGQRLLVHRDGHVEKLASAIELLKSIWVRCEGLEAIPQRVKKFLRAELGACLFDQYIATGNLGDLDSAIEHLQALSEDDDALENTLGLAHYERFLQLGELDDLDRALFHGCKVCGLGDAQIPHPSASPSILAMQNPDLTAGRHLYGLVLAQRFTMTLDIRDLDRAVVSCRKALGDLSSSHPLKTVYQASLACILFARFEAEDEEDEEDLRAALDVIQAAVSQIREVLAVIPVFLPRLSTDTLLLLKERRGEI